MLVQSQGIYKMFENQMNAIIKNKVCLPLFFIVIQYLLQKKCIYLVPNTAFISCDCTSIVNSYHNMNPTGKNHT